MAERETAKANAARQAVTHVKDGMTLGIGTGSTAKHFIKALAGKIEQGWALAGVPTSEETRRLALAAGVEIIDPDETTVIDLAVDGADEIDPALNLIKGGGGALLREKIVAAAANKFIVIADNSKRVAKLGAFPLPIEIEPFAWALTVGQIRRLIDDITGSACRVSLRSEGSALFRSDGGNLILDCQLERIDCPKDLEARLDAIPGVVESGLFCGMTDLAMIGVGERVVTEIP